MASASKTPKLNLPQWEGTEKPERTDFNAAFDAIDDEFAVVGGKFISESWITPTLLSDWVNYDAVNESVAGYYKDAMGVVHLKGTLKGGVGSGTIWNLPAGYRPSERQWFATSINSSFSYVAVYTNGNIIPLAAGGTGRTILNGISFRAAGT